MRRGTGIAVLLAAALSALVGCAGSAEPTHEITAPFAACPASWPTPGPTQGQPASAPARPLPALTLPCFTGGDPVRLAALGQPAVINLWASWCGPCRKELPELQRFADAAAGRVVVIGVVTGDTRADASAAGTRFGVRFPALYDPDSALLNTWGRPGLPITLFADAWGRVRHEEVGGSLTLARTSELVAEHLGVRL